VKPGFWYHIAGWAYEEPSGEVLDPVKLLNSYGFGLCYHIAPLLEAVYKAGGFEDARVWFLTGHTVAEVFYQGAYHYFDSDMMGYNSVGAGDPRRSPVASVHQLEQDGQIMLCKLKLRAISTPSSSTTPGTLPTCAKPPSTALRSFPRRKTTGCSRSLAMRPGTACSSRSGPVSG